MVSLAFLQGAIDLLLCVVGCRLCIFYGIFVNLACKIVQPGKIICAENVILMNFCVSVNINLNEMHASMSAARG